MMSVRDWCKRLLGAAVVFAAGALSATQAQVPAQVKTQAPGYYRMQLGGVEVTALYDGYFDMDTKLLKNAPQAEIQRLVARMFQTLPTVQTAVNAYLIHTGRNLVLIDAGTAKLFGPQLGFVLDNLRAAGYRPEQVDTVLLTHLHADHVGGVLTPDGKPAFPNAQVLAAKVESDFWLSEANAANAPKEAQAFFKMARDAVAPYIAAQRYKTFAANDEPVPGIKAVPLPGHTPGHTGFLIGEGDNRLLIWGDIVHNFAVQFVDPRVAIEFDVDSAKAVETRLAQLARAAREKYWVAGAHLPFPGIGHIRPDGHGYVYVPANYSVPR